MKARWTHRPEIMSYIIDSYAGTERTNGNGMKRRVFIWEEGTELKMGNCEAFTEHLVEKFELIRAATSDVHQLLRDLGESVQQHKPHGARSPNVGKYQAPEPDSWVIGVVTNPEAPTEPE